MKSGKKNNKSEASPAYSASTVGLSKDFFTFGTTKDAAAFLITKSRLAWHVGTQSWPGAANSSRAIEDIKYPDMNKHCRPVVKKQNVVWDSDDPMFKIQCEECTEDMK